jgi:hypothetical protein
MSHTFQVSDEEYANIVSYAQSHDETPETLFRYWVQGKIDRIKILGSTPREQANRKEEGGCPNRTPGEPLKQIQKDLGKEMEP